MRTLVIGGNRYFGKLLVEELIARGFDVTLLNRGNLNDGFGDEVKRIKCDRANSTQLESAVVKLKWDIIFDQACYDFEQATSAVNIFRNKTRKYVFTSSQSVYDLGSNLNETAFNPKKYKFSEKKTMQQDYAEAK